jgi:LAGLIDADG endonuclease
MGAYGSDNPGGADDQQERLIQLGWVLGFVDGEGCFSIGFVRQAGGRGRVGYRTGYQVSHRFAVTQNESGLASLEELESFFGVGRIFVYRRHDNHRERLAQYVVDRRVDLVERIIPFLEAHPLRTASARTSRSSRSACG